MSLKTTLILEERDAYNTLKNIYTIGDIINILTKNGTKLGRIYNINIDTIELDTSRYLNGKYEIIPTKNIYSIIKSS